MMKPTYFFVIVALAVQAQADTIYTNQADFLDAAGPTILESYETYSATDQTNQITTNHFTATTQSLANASATIYIRDEPSQGLLRATHGEKYLVMGHYLTNMPTERASRLTFHFDHPITELGMSIVDFGDFGTGELLLNNNQIAAAPLPNGNELFVGIVTDDPFTQITLDKMTTKDGIGIDEMYFTVPEPSTLFLLLSVFLLAAGRYILPLDKSHHP